MVKHIQATRWQIFIFAKHTALDVWQGFEYNSDYYAICFHDLCKTKP